jgi:hypothetical protein
VDDPFTLAVRLEFRSKMWSSVAADASRMTDLQEPSFQHAYDFRRTGGLVVSVVETIVGEFVDHHKVLEALECEEVVS